MDTYNKTKEQVLQGYEGYKETTIGLYNDAGELIEKTVNYLDDKGFKTDEEVKAEEAEKARQEEIERAVKAFEELLSRVSEETRRILEETGWDGELFKNTNNTEVLNQMDLNELKKVGLPDSTGACVFLSTVYGAADAMGITLSPEDIAAIYKDAKKNGRVDVDWGTYGVQNYPGIIKSVATVKGIDASNILIPDTQIKISPALSQEVTKDIIGALQNGGSAQVRYSGHSMRVDGFFIENGNIILSIKDTVSPKRETYVDTSNMTLYTLNKKKERVPSDRVITHYLPITKKNNVSSSR